MVILPKKQIKNLKLQLFERIIEILPGIIVFLVVSIIGTCLGWRPSIIVKSITAIAGNNIIVTIIVRIYEGLKKTN